MIFARIGHGPCYYHWNEIFAGVYRKVASSNMSRLEADEVFIKMPIKEILDPYVL